MSYQRFSRQGAVALGLVMSACGGAPINQAKLAEAQSALHAAETLGANKDPKAKQFLQLAREQTEKAASLAKEGDGDEANLLLERATADADLASQLMRTQSARDLASQAQAKLKTIAENTGESR